MLAEFGRIEAVQEAGNPSLLYSDLLAVVHRDLAANLDLDTNEDMDVAFGASVPNWPEFADSAGALAFLSERYRLVILSNVDRTSFAGSNERLKVEFDAIYTAEDIGSYKPDPANFDYLLGHLEDDFDVVAGLGPPRRSKLVPRPCTGQSCRSRHGMDRPAAPVSRRRVGCNYTDRGPTRTRPRVLLHG